MKSFHRLLLILFLALAPTAFCASSTGTSNDHSEITVGPVKVDTGSSGAAIFLFGAFCALWAQNTQRNAWLWFFLGIFFSVITVLVLLYKNSKDKDEAPPSSFDLSGHRIQ